MPFNAEDRLYLREILALVKRSIKMLEELKAEVARNAQVDAAAKALIVGLANKLEELAASAVDPDELAAELNALVTELRASSDDLAAAVATAEEDDEPA